MLLRGVVDVDAVGGERFDDLARALPSLSDKVLTDRLTQLTSAGIVDRSRTPGWPPRVSYTLTERGYALVPVLQALWDWGSRLDDASV
ncbi:winged helix-turn-helix transcriptional regulator [Nocardia otitidiscaviarum]|uniref:winged helix-turn-helix transcriptional regulator n=1 Tax=Nocardia otitidiscaviarum TaxID=1823 RepID=UPI0034DD21AA